MIKVEHLSKSYGGFQAVKDLSFEIPEGQVYGFLGPNGAGKSTTMNIMTGCLSATDGRVLIDGHDIFEEPQEAKKLIGYLPEQPPLYMHESPEDYLRFVGEAKGVKGQELRDQVEQVIEKTRLEPVRHQQISALSKGYKQRVGIAQALLGNPKVIILDEPTVGLDPIQIVEIRDLIRQLGQDHTVILSSHILSEVQTICQKILIISGGELIAYDTPENLEARMRNPEIRLLTEADPETAHRILEKAGLEASHLDEGEKGCTLIRLDARDQELYDLSRKLFFAFAEEKKAILELNLQKATLEDIFLQLTESSPEKDSQAQEDKEAEEN